MDVLPDSLVLLVLHSVAPRRRPVRLSHALVCRSWKALVRAEEIMHVHISSSPKASAMPAMLPGFVHDDALGCRIRIGATVDGLPRLGQRLARAIELVMLAYRSSVASASIASLRLEDFKGELSRVLPGLLFQAARVATLTTTRVRASSLHDVHLVRCVLPFNLTTMLAHVRRLRIWDCQTIAHMGLATIVSGFENMTALYELCWGVWHVEPKDTDWDMAEVVASTLPCGLRRLVMTRPLQSVPQEVWHRVAPSLEELVLIDACWPSFYSEYGRNSILSSLRVAAPMLTSLHTLQVPCVCNRHVAVTLLPHLPSLTSLGQLDCPYDRQDPVDWMASLAAPVRLKTLYVHTNSPGASFQETGSADRENWACEAGGASIYACALQRIAYGLATRMKSLERLFIEYYDEGSIPGLRGVPLSDLALALEPLQRGLVAIREVHLLRGNLKCALFVEDGGTALISAARASQLLSERLAPLRVTVHYEGSATEGCYQGPEWALEDAVSMCPSLHGFAVPRRPAVHRELATNYPKLAGGFVDRRRLEHGEDDVRFPIGFEEEPQLQQQGLLRQWMGAPPPV